MLTKSPVQVLNVTGIRKVVNPQTKAFVLRVKGTNLGHEKEVLFSSEAVLTLRNKTLITNKYKVGKVINGGKTIKKHIPAYVLEIDIT